MTKKKRRDKEAYTDIANAIVIITSLVDVFGTLRKEQFIRYFESVWSEYQTECYLDSLTSMQYLVYNKETDCYSHPMAVYVRDEVQERATRAFWVLAAVGYKNVQYFRWISCALTQFLFVGSNNEIYEVSVVDQRNDAIMAQRMRNTHTCSHFATRIAVLRTAEDTKLLEGCDFDCYCTIDPVSKEVSYRTIEEG